jgi:hypothetical protein
MAELYRRKESRYWWMAFTFNGKLYRFSTGKEKRDEAKLAMDERVAQYLKGFHDVTRNARELTYEVGRPIAGDVLEAAHSHAEDPQLSHD